MGGAVSMLPEGGSIRTIERVIGNPRSILCHEAAVGLSRP
jgi:hypothetical protein